MQNYETQYMNLVKRILSEGYKVTGSDKPDHFFTEAGLVEKGIPFHEFNPDMITKDMIIVQGNAFNDEHPEVKKAHELGLKIFTYQEMIAEITNDNKLVAVCGCHGKTTTTTMMKTVLEPFGVNYLIGDGTGYAKKGNDYFLAYNPYYTIVTNIELDHTDYYKDLDDVMDAFTEFVSKTRKAVIMCGDDVNNRKVKTDKPVYYYGFDENNDIVVKNITHDEETTKADVYIKGKLYDTYIFPFVGDHLLLNVLGVITVCYLENLPKDVVKNQVSKIKHAKRRFIEEKFRNNILIDDYAHHPTEVKVTIEAARKKYPDREIVALFKAHTRSRVQYFHKEFADALNLADKCYVMEIGEDRKEVGYEKTTHEDILKDCKNGEFISLETADKLLQYKNSVLLFMSSKDIYLLEDEYKRLASK